MSNEKFELVEGSKIEFEGHTLHRIRALKNIDCFNGGPYIKRGELGGYVEDLSNLFGFGPSWIGGDAKVYGGARIDGGAVATDSAIVNGKSIIYGHAKIEGNAVVGENSRVHGYASIWQDANVSLATISGVVQICGDAIVMGSQGERVILEGDLYIESDVWTYPPLLIKGTRDHFQEAGHGKLAIGCIEKRLDWWLANYKRAGEENDYTDQQIREYKMYIDLFASLLENRKEK